jgi:hypothetical protein
VAVIDVNQPQAPEPRRNQHIAERQDHAIRHISVNQHEDDETDCPVGHDRGEEVADPREYRDRDQIEQQPRQREGQSAQQAPGARGR